MPLGKDEGPAAGGEALAVAFQKGLTRIGCRNGQPTARDRQQRAGGESHQVVRVRNVLRFHEGGELVAGQAGIVPVVTPPMTDAKPIRP
jgi:hypothetical protein